MAIKHFKAICNKTRQKLSYLGWPRPLNVKKSVPRVSKRTRDTTVLTVKRTILKKKLTGTAYAVDLVYMSL